MSKSQQKSTTISDQLIKRCKKLGLGDDLEKINEKLHVIVEMMKSPQWKDYCEMLGHVYSDMKKATTRPLQTMDDALVFNEYAGFMRGMDKTKSLTVSIIRLSEDIKQYLYEKG